MAAVKRRSRITIEYAEVPLADVVDYFVAGYKTGRKITRHEWFIDFVHQEVVLKLHIERDHAP